MYFSYGDKKIYYETFGEGFPFIVIHEWNLSSSLFLRAYKKIAGNKIKFFLIDLPGFGRSESIPSLNFETLTEIIDCLLNELNIQKAYFIGSCLGAIIALDYAIRRKERVKGLILVEIMMYFPLPFLMLFLPVLGKFIMKIFSKTDVGLKIFTFFMWGKNIKLKRMFECSIKSTKESISWQYLRLLYDYSKIDHYKRTKNLDMSVILINGESTIPPIKKSIEKLQKYLQKAHTFIIKSSKHFPLYENPEKIMEIIERNCF